MKKLALFISFALVLTLFACTSEPEQTGEQSGTATETETTSETTPVSDIQPQNGIPLVIVRVDESDEAISNANEADSDHTYGTIEQMNESEDHSVRCVGSVEVIVPDGFESDYGSSEVPVGQIQLDYIRGRGNTTWLYGNKKPYKFKVTEPAGFLGMGESKEWALLANYLEPSLLRNYLSFWLGDQMELKYTPQMVPVDVVMVGSDNKPKYLGSYYLSELVGVESSRLDINKLKKDDTADSANITGGYLLSIYEPEQDADLPETTWFTTDTGHIQITNETPSFDSEDLSQGRSEQRAYIRQYVNQLDSLIMSSGDIDQARHDQIAEMLDLTSLADYWLIQEMSSNGDAFITGSTYMYKEQDGKLFFGPLWDFDRAWQSDGETMGALTAGLNTTEFKWTDKLRESDPLFVELLRERWEVMDSKLDEITRSGGKLDQFRQLLSASHFENTKLWDEHYTDGDGDNFDEQVEELRGWIEQRRSWINDHIDEMGNVYYTVTYMSEGQVVHTERVRGNTILDKGPEMPSRSGYIFLGWVNAEDGSEHADTILLGDMTFNAYFVSEREVTQPEHIYYRFYETWASFEEPFTQYHGTVEVVPNEVETLALDHAVWSSSDTDIATVDSDGCVHMIRPGDVTITCTLFNGVSESYLMHIYDKNSTPPAAPASISVSSDSLNLRQGQTSQLRYGIDTNGVPCGNYLVNFESSDPSVADVTGLTGVVTAVGEGTATITVTVEFGLFDNAVLTKTCEVTVTR